MSDKIIKTEAEWQELLGPEAYRVLREKGTERPFTGEFDHFFAPGVFTCRACGAPLFSSEDKYDSGCGWPAFSKVMENDNLVKKMDYSHGMTRVEVLCARCDGHLGHVFPDGPGPTKERYCINSVSLKFVPKQD